MTSDELAAEFDRIEQELGARGWATAGSNTLDASPRSLFVGWMISVEEWPDLWRIVEMPATAALRQAKAEAAQ